MAETYPIDGDTLAVLKEAGVDSPVLQARLRYADHNQILTHYIEPLVGVARVYPKMLPTQASGRWSTTEPPLVNFSKDKKWGSHGIRDVVVPDPGWKWVHFDWDAVEARIVAAWCGDQGDIEAFNKGYDIHTLTACGMYKWPLPPFEPTKENLFKSEQGAAYCREIGYLVHKPECGVVGACSHTYHSYSDDSRARTLAKNCRYSLAYGPDETPMATYAVEMKIPRDVLLEAGKRYLASKPALVAWKKRTWTEIARTRVARTFMGRRRLCMGSWNTGAKVQEFQKQGLNHMVQGSVADVMNLTIIQVISRWPLAWLVLNSHDGSTFAFPTNVEPFPDVREIAERTWTIGGNPMKFTASWDTVYSPEGEGNHGVA